MGAGGAERYHRNPVYRAKRLGKAYYIRHQNGARLRTDRMVNLIWDKAEGRTFSEIKREVERRTSISGWLLAAVLNIMVRADLLIEAGGRRQEAGGEPGEEKSAVGSPNPEDARKVSVVIVNRDGEDHLTTLLPSLARQDYPNVEVVMVDNGSRDRSVDLVKQYFPTAKVVELKKNVGFAEGNNVGIARAGGDYIFLLNNDTELADDCISQLAAAAGRRKNMAAVVPKMYLWRLPRFINAIGNSVWPRGWGSDNFIGYLDIGQFDAVEEVFSACFGAVMIGREALDKVGPLDPRYKFYYEDADWSYRARLQGMKIYFAPKAKVYHKFNASMQGLASTFKWQLVIGNRLRFAAKTLSPGTWLNFMRNYAKEDIRSVLRNLKHRDWPMTIIYFRAWWRFLVNLPNIIGARRQIQRTRTLKDAKLFELWPELPPLVDEGGNPILDMGTIRRIYLHYLPDAENHGPPGSPVRGHSF